MCGVYRAVTVTVAGCVAMVMWKMSVKLCTMKSILLCILLSNHDVFLSLTKVLFISNEVVGYNSRTMQVKIKAKCKDKDRKEAK